MEYQLEALMNKTSVFMKILLFLFLFENYLLTGDGQTNVSHSPCGAVNRVIPLIVGGREIAFNRYPWLALVLLENHFHCGGSLINSFYVLTAGHCVSPFGRTINPENIKIVLGAHNISNRKEHSRIYRRVESIRLHEDFHGDEIHDVHDIALMRLDKRIGYTRHVGPVCLPEFLDENVYKIPKGRVIGWGSKNYIGQISSIPSEALLNILSDKECEKVTGYNFKQHFIEERGSMFCAYSHNHDACKE